MTLKTTMAVVAVAALVLGIGDVERGNRLYRAGQYAEAVEAYRAALADGEDSPQLQYNLGTALLRLERYDDAQRHLEAALAAVEPELRRRTLYNLGNRFLEPIMRHGESDEQVRRRHLDLAVESYRSALRIDPDDMDAKWNLELAQQQQEAMAGGGGGGDGEDDEQQQSGEGADQEQPASEQPQPRSPRPDGSAMSREQAEQILNAVEQDERELYQDQLRKGSRETPVIRDW